MKKRLLRIANGLLAVIMLMNLLMMPAAMAEEGNAAAEAAVAEALPPTDVEGRSYVPANAIKKTVADVWVDYTSNGVRRAHLPEYATDGDLNTYWHAPWSAGSGAQGGGLQQLPISVKTEFTQPQSLSMVEYHTVKDGKTLALVNNYEIWVHPDKGIDAAGEVTTENGWIMAGQGTNTAMVSDFSLAQGTVATTVCLKGLSNVSADSVSIGSGNPSYQINELRFVMQPEEPTDPDPTPEPEYITREDIAKVDADTWISYEDRIHTPEQFVDGDPQTYWHAPWSASSASNSGTKFLSLPIGVKAEFVVPRTLTSLEYIVSGAKAVSLKGYEIWIHPTKGIADAGAVNASNGWVKVGEGADAKAEGTLAVNEAPAAKSVCLLGKNTSKNPAGTGADPSFQINELKFKALPLSVADMKEQAATQVASASKVLTYVQADVGSGQGQFDTATAEMLENAVSALGTIIADDAATAVTVQDGITALREAVVSALSSNLVDPELETLCPPANPVIMTGTATEAENSGANLALDGDENTAWVSGGNSDYELDLNATMLLDSIQLQQRSGNNTGLIRTVNVYAGEDAGNATLLESFTLPGTSVVQGAQVTLPLPYVHAAYLRLELNDGGTASMAEVNVTTYDRGIVAAADAWQNAQKAADEAEVGTEIGQFPSQDIIDTFRAELVALGNFSQVTKNSAGYTHADSINNALDLFSGKVNMYTKDDLLAVINQAKALLETLESDSDKAALNAAIGKAEAVHSKQNATKEEVQNAVVALMGEIKIFQAGGAAIDLSGEWTFKLGGYTDSTIKVENLTETVILPGTLDTNEKGNRTDPNVANEKRLSRKYTYSGLATYQKELYIPGSYEGKTITLFMERSRVTRLWLNGKEVTTQERNAPAAFQRYDIGKALNYGTTNTITIVVDNTYATLGSGVSGAITGSHMASEETQGNWNGILGRFEIQAQAAVAVDALRVYPNSDLKSAKVEIDLKNSGAQAYSGKLTLRAGDLSPMEIDVSVPAGETKTVTVDAYSMGANPKLWSEFTPENRYEMTAVLDNGDTKSTSFGMRSFQVNSETKKLSINGMGAFMRSETNNAVFPITGYAPMDKASWIKLLGQYQEYGLNAVRFHSWCPPDAAFAAADELGMYLWVETSHWTNSKSAEVIAQTKKEAQAILRSFANHPSFVMLAYCNEPNGGFSALNGITPVLKEQDPTRLYFIGSNQTSWKPESNDDVSSLANYNKTKSWWLRGSASGNRGFVYKELPTSMVNHNGAADNFVADEKASTSGASTALVSHEVGQYQVFPNYSYELDGNKYTGVMVPRNLEHWRKLAYSNGFTDAELDSYTKASGMVARLCYRLEVEAAMRTQNLSGMALLGIQDFPGQGTALIGMMDVFGKPKGNAQGAYEFSNPDDFKKFCDSVVPTMELERFTWKNNQTLSGDLFVSNYSATDLVSDVTLVLKDKKTGRVVATETSANCDIKQGQVNKIATQSFPLGSVATASQLTLEITVVAINKTNSYDIWVYPAETKPQAGGVYITDRWSDDVMARLQNGEKVLLMPAATAQNFPKSVDGVFPTNFWAGSRYINWGGGGGAGTMGLMMDPEHPVFSAFPTEYYSNFQWASIAMNGRPMNITGVAGATPLVTVMDDYSRAWKMSTLFETKVGTGKLIVCSMGLNEIENQYPEAKQMKKSVLDYMNSDKFTPSGTMTVDEVSALVTPSDGLFAQDNVALKTNGGVFTGSIMVEGSRPQVINDGDKNVDDGKKSWSDYTSKDQATMYTKPLTAEFAFPKSVVHTAVIYLHDDGSAVRVPEKVILEYWDGTNFVPVEGQSATAGMVKGKNKITFTAVETTKLRAVMDHKENKAAIGVAEFELYRKPIALESLRIEPVDGIRTVRIGGQLQLKAIATPAEIKNPDVIWGLQDEGFPESPAQRAKVSETGVVTGEKTGNVIIRVSDRYDSSIFAEYTVSVTDKDFCVKTTANEGGTLSGDGAIFLNADESVLVQITAEENYELAAIFLNDEDVTDKVVNNRFILSGIQADGVLEAIFQRKDAPNGTTYYVDAANGDDGNDGQTPGTAWATLDKVNATTFAPGDKILLKAGQIWSGYVWPKGNGTKIKPITLGRYGEGANPIINGNGEVPFDYNPAQILKDTPPYSAAVYLCDQSNWIVEHLEVTNSHDNKLNRAGIILYTTGTEGKSENLTVRNCFVHDVTDNSGATGNNKMTGGILVIGSRAGMDGKIPAKPQTPEIGFHNVLIENNHVKDVSKEGIRSTGLGQGFRNAKAHTKLVLRGNYIENTFGDGIVLSEVARDGLVESNIVKNHSITGAANFAGAWYWSSKNSAFRYNEVFGGTQGYNDGEAFDFDLNCSNLLYEYNYSHDNAGGLLLTMQQNTTDTFVFRYNISANDGKASQELFHLAPTNAKIYNNTMYIGSHKTTAIFQKGAVNFFKNNIIVAEDAASVPKFAQAPITAAGIENNIFFPKAIVEGENGLADDVKAKNLFVDPKLADPTASNDFSLASYPLSPETAGTGSAFIEGLRARAAIFMLQADSPAIDKGVGIEEYTGTDFFGNPVGTKPDIGAHEYTTVTPVTGVTLSESTLALLVDETAQLTATVSPANATDQGVIWTSDAPEVAMVEGGLVVANGEGTATITVTTRNGNFTASCIVEVGHSAPPPISGNGGGSTTTTVKNEDGSITTTVTNKTTGTITQTTVWPNGDKTVVQTKKDGTVTETVTRKDGFTSKTVTAPDGSSVSNVVDARGTKIEMTTTAQGETTARITLAEGVERTAVTIPVKNATPGTVAVLVKKDGTKTIVKHSTTTADGLRVILDGNAELTLVDNSKHFEDVSAQSWYYSAVQFAASRELMGGTGEAQFAPMGQVSRATLITILHRLSGAEITNAGDTWYSDAVAWGVKSGITDGTNVTENITREAFVTMLYRYAAATPGEDKLREMPDAGEVSPWAVEAMSWAVSNGILTGNGEGKLLPKGNASRAEAAAILQRFINHQINGAI